MKLFASANLAEHLLRGIIGIGLFAWAAQHQDALGLSLLAALGALIAFRGCPICWTIGLFETIRNQFKPPPANEP
jgi:hypothetical protein